METEPIWIGSTYCTSSRINTLVLTLSSARVAAGDPVVWRPSLLSASSNASTVKLSEIDLGCVDLSKPESRHQLSRVITIPNRQSSPPCLYLVKVVSRIILVSSVVLLKIISQLFFEPVQPIPG